MIRNLKALGLALFATCALGAVAAQVASAATEHEFHAEEERVIGTGENNGTVKFKIGSIGTIECNKMTTEGTQIGTKVSENTYKSDTITVVPTFSECTFGGQPATVNFNHCAYVLDSDTTTGNGTAPEKEHANIEIECAQKEGTGESTKVEAHTSTCTLTVSPQVVKHAVHYKNGLEGGFETTSEKVVIGKVRTTASQPVNGCLIFPTGAIASATATVKSECFADEGSPLEGTTRTTPSGLTTEGESVGCTVSPGA